MSKQLTKKTNGFTIIEILIVLAIAGVIMLVVFLAVPALQRNSRNTQRRSDAGHMAGLINEWEANHAGTAYTISNSAGATAGPDLANENFSIMTKPAVATAVAAFATAPATITLDSFTYIYRGAICTNGTTAAVSASTSSFVILFSVEPQVAGAYQCIGG